VLADAESWPHWATAITKVTWTSPQPRGVGTTRTVNMRGGIVGDEEFLAWEPFTHMAFRFNEASSGSIAALAEDYRVVPTPSGCHLTWVMAMKPNGVAGRLGMTLGRPVMARTFQKFLYNLRAYADKRYAPPYQYRRAQALRRSASGSSTTLSRADWMIRVNRCSMS
jgi:hypothetical protein